MKPIPTTEWLENTLREAGTWKSAKELGLAAAKTIGCTVCDRTVRALASNSCKIISGQKGYCHLSAAKSEDVTHFVNLMKSQAAEMRVRADRVEHFYLTATDKELNS